LTDKQLVTSASSSTQASLKLVVLGEERLIKPLVV